MTDMRLQKMAAYCWDRGVKALNSGRFERAESLLKEATEADPNSGILFYNLGFCFFIQGKYEQAEESYKEATELDPKNASFWCNRGRNFYEWGKYTEAEDCYEIGMKWDEKHLVLLYNLADLRLTLGDFENGWQYYEARPPVGMKANNPRYSKPRWWGENPRGKTIFVHAEQGLGDTLQFIRYVKELEEVGFSVIAEVQKELIPLLSSTFENLITYDDPVPEHDYQITLMSIPMLLTRHIADIPSQCGYIKADAKLVEHWKMRLQDEISFPKIAVNWKGRGAGELYGYPGVKLRTSMMGYRDIPCCHFLNLAASLGTKLVSLQKGESVPSAAMIDPAVLQIGSYDSRPFVDTAAIMMGMDLVITNDTAIAHLAGALGVPVWVLLPQVPNWRWLLDRSDSPWYPSMRLFRQPKQGDWESVFEEVKSVLRKEFQCWF